MIFEVIRFKFVTGEILVKVHVTREFPSPPSTLVQKTEMFERAIS